MKRAKLIVASEQEDLRVLVVDKVSVLGDLLKQEIHLQFANAQITNIGNFRKQPKIPDAPYSHMVLVVGDIESKRLIPEFLNKAVKDKSKVFIVVSVYSPYVKTLIQEVVRETHARVLVIGEVFGKEVPFNPEYVIHRFFQAAARSKKLMVRGMGMQKIHPVFIHDVISGMLQVLFGQAEEAAYYLYPQNSPTELSVATAFLKQDPSLTMDFEQYEEKNDPEQIGGSYIIDDSYNLSEKIRQEKGLYSEVPEETLKGAAKREKSGGVGKAKIAMAIMGFFLLPFVVAILSLLVGFGMVQGARYSFEKGNIESAKASIQLAQVLFSVPQKVGSALSLPMSQDFIFIQELLSGSEYLLNSAYHFQKVLYGNTTSPQEDFAEGINNAKHATIAYQKLQAEYSLRKEKSLIIQRYSRLDSFLGGTHSLGFLQLLFQNTADSLPDVFGIEKKKKYLILFQNNMELRPGGGFIGSYGLLDIDKGKVENFSIHDVYDADGQLKAHIEPPFAIRRHLPSVHWYLRDSNFNVDFSKGASASAYFLKEETNVVVDGVVGVDTSFIKNILEVTGSVFVADYNEWVTSENFVILTQKYVQKDFFPGSTQKKDFLRSLFYSLSQEILKKNVSYLKLLEIIDKSISEKHLLFAFSDSDIQNVFANSNASSTLKDTRVEDEERINDFLGVSEANVGVNKVNYYIKRKISHHVGIADSGLISSQVGLMYKNTSSGESAQAYKAYIQVVVPMNSQLTEIIIDNKVVEIVPAVTDPRVYENKKFIKPQGLEVETSEQEGKTIFGFLITVPSDALQTVVVRYVLQKFFPLDAPSPVYSYRHFKQPGTDGTLLSYSFEYPSLLTVLSKPEMINQKEYMLRFETELKKDILFDIMLRQE